MRQSGLAPLQPGCDPTNGCCTLHCTPQTRSHAAHFCRRLVVSKDLLREQSGVLSCDDGEHFQAEARAMHLQGTSCMSCCCLLLMLWVEPCSNNRGLKSANRRFCLRKLPLQQHIGWTGHPMCNKCLSMFTMKHGSMHICAVLRKRCRACNSCHSCSNR